MGSKGWDCNHTQRSLSSNLLSWGFNTYQPIPAMSSNSRVFNTYRYGREEGLQLEKNSFSNIYPYFSSRFCHKRHLWREDEWYQNKQTILEKRGEIGDVLHVWCKYDDSFLLSIMNLARCLPVNCCNNKKMESAQCKLSIIFGTQTGQSKSIAEEMTRKASENGYDVEMVSMDDSVGKVYLKLFSLLINY